MRSASFATAKALLAASTAALLPSASLAATAPTGDKVIARACVSHAGQSINEVRLAEALVIEMGLLPSDLAPDGASIRDKVWTLGNPAGPTNTATAPFQKAVQLLETELRRGEVRVSPPSSQLTGWIFDPARSFTVTCPDADPEKPFDDKEALPLIAIRGDVDALAARGKGRIKAEAFSLGLSRVRSILDDGTAKSVTSMTIDGAVGLRLTSPKADDVAHLYALYSLSRTDIRPAPALAAGAKPDDGYTNALEFGVSGNIQLTPNEAVAKVYASGRTGFVHDFIHDSDLARIKLTLEPGFDAPLGICGFGSYKPISRDQKVYARCGAIAEVEVAHIFRAGTSKFGASDNYLAVGGKLSYDVFVPTLLDDGVIASASYRYLPVLTRGLGDIHRLEAKVAYRIWTAQKLGFDIGASYIIGTNAESFERDDQLKFGVGVIF